MMLREAYDRILHEPFPDHATGDELSLWQFDLLKVDGFVAGIASTVLEGGPMDYPNVLAAVEQLKTQLSSVSVEEEDLAIYEQCCLRVDLLRVVARVLVDRMSSPTEGDRGEIDAP
jgi:hypothetical protein